MQRTPNHEGAGAAGGPAQLALGCGVDSRLLQANERTLLAWIRTGIALLALGFMITRIGLSPELSQSLQPQDRVGSALLGVAFVILGAVGNGLAVYRYVTVRTLLLRGETLRVQDRAPLVFGMGVTLIASFVGLYLVLRMGFDFF